jgi:hypothetical protein
MANIAFGNKPLRGNDPSEIVYDPDGIVYDTSHGAGTSNGAGGVVVSTTAKCVVCGSWFVLRGKNPPVKP